MSGQKKPYTPPNAYSLSGSISYEEAIGKINREPLSKKPRKEKAVSELHQRVTDGSRYLLNAGIKQDHITNWMFEPWEYNSIIEARDWWDETLMPAIRELIMVINVRSAGAWKSLASMNPNHPDFKQIRIYQKKLKEAWFRRPRWQGEKGRVLEEGY